MSKLILEYGNGRGRYLCKCGILYETRHSYHDKYKCKRCGTVINGESESIYLTKLRDLGFIHILQQYTHEDLVSKKGNKLSFDIALLQSSSDLLPYFLFEVLSYNNLNNTNQDGLRDNYIKKVLFARDVLRVPMVEFGVHTNKELISIIIEAKEKYETLLKIDDPRQYLLELNRNFYEPIINRVGKYHFAGVN